MTIEIQLEGSQASQRLQEMNIFQCVRPSPDNILRSMSVARLIIGLDKAIPTLGYMKHIFSTKDICIAINAKNHEQPTCFHKTKSKERVN